MAEEGVEEEAMAETKLHHQPLMSDAKDHFGLLSDPFLLTVFSMVADDKSLMHLKEMGGNDTIGRSRGTTNAGKSSEQQTEKKKGFGKWINLMKPDNEEKDHWSEDYLNIESLLDLIAKGCKFD
ncbi:hypothetical protein QJS10_CPB20g00621 [Acorus calamus]|uniref:Uncharacterized protein n=1 Tax=Acorus calamus TaxID=4465 RepID=A0AAV9C9S5_ACOCL|nr:hypothetical protein QJS10_CPB20g00621 [Acorus calamus]